MKGYNNHYSIANMKGENRPGYYHNTDLVTYISRHYNKTIKMAAEENPIARELLNIVSPYSYKDFVLHITANDHISYEEFKNHELNKEYWLDTRRSYLGTRLRNPDVLYEIFGSFSEESASQVREDILTRILMEKEFYAKVCRFILGVRGCDIESWVDEMRSHHMFGDEITLYALSRTYNRHSTVILKTRIWTTMASDTALDLGVMLDNSHVLLLYIGCGVFGELKRRPFDSNTPLPIMVEDLQTALKVVKPRGRKQQKPLDLKIKPVQSRTKKPRKTKTTRDDHTYAKKKTPKVQTLEIIEPDVTPYPTGILPVDMEQFDAEQVKELNEALITRSVNTLETPAVHPIVPCVVTDFEMGIADTTNTKDCAVMVHKLDDILKADITEESIVKGQDTATGPRTNAVDTTNRNVKPADTACNTEQQSPVIFHHQDKIKKCSVNLKRLTTDMLSKLNISVLSVGPNANFAPTMKTNKTAPAPTTERDSPITSSAPAPIPDQTTSTRYEMRSRKSLHEHHCKRPHRHQKPINYADLNSDTEKSPSKKPKKHKVTISEPSSIRQRAQHLIGLNNKPKGTPPAPVYPSVRKFSTKNPERAKPRHRTFFKQEMQDIIENIDVPARHTRSTAKPEPPETVKSYDIKIKPKVLKKHKPVRKFKCPCCKENPETIAELNNHFKATHPPLVCKICKATFNTPSGLMRHRYIHKPPRFNCDQCEEKFYFSSELARHKLTHRTIAGFFCHHKNCGKSYMNKPDLLKHVRTHTKKLLHCDQCDSYHTKNIKNLRNHKKLHTADKPYQCKICKERFKHNNQLRRHKMKPCKKGG